VDDIRACSEVVFGLCKTQDNGSTPGSAVEKADARFGLGAVVLEKMPPV
jgi:hypothetical protein